MRIVRYLDTRGFVHYGAEQPDGSVLRIEGDVFREHRETKEPARIGQLLAPVVPADVFCIGLNYRRHAAESNMQIPQHPVLFMKGVGSLQHPGAPIVLPRSLRSREVDYECEMAVVIGRRCKNATRDNALDFVLGYTCANDVSARDWQIRFGGSQWCRGKTFDTFCPLGPRLVTSEEIPDPNALAIRTRLNGEIVQDWNTSDMIFDVRSLIVFLSASTTLLPGTVILTGTPHGVGMAQKPPRWLRAGDVVEIEVEGIGVLSNPVEEESVPTRDSGARCDDADTCSVAAS